MEFTESFDCFNANNTRLSPNGSLIASLAKKEQGSMFLKILSTNNGNIIRKFPIAASISNGQRWEIQWSPNSSLVAIINFPLSKIEIFDINGETDIPISIIQENRLLGSEKFLWAPDSLQVFTILRHKMGIRIWGLLDRFPRAFFANNKFTEKGITFTSDGKFAAILQRKDSQDFILILDCYDATWKVIQTLRPPESTYIEGISFCPIKDHSNDIRPAIVAWEGPTFSDRLFIFSPDGGNCKVITQNDSTSKGDSSMLYSGFEKFIWSKDGWIGIVIKAHNTLCIWNCITQKMSPTIDLERRDYLVPDKSIIFKEKVTKEVNNDGIISDQRSRYESSYQISISKVTDNKRIPTLQVEISPDSKYFAAHCNEYPNILWVFNVTEMYFCALLQQIQPIKSFHWHHSNSILTLVTESSNVYIWQASGCLCIPQPTVPDVKIVQWANFHDTLLISGSHSFCLATPDWVTY